MPALPDILKAENRKQKATLGGWRARVLKLAAASTFDATPAP
jgi:hypothetical protein